MNPKPNDAEPRSMSTSRRVKSLSLRIRPRPFLPFGFGGSF
jgi:hypothetical protein